MDEYEFEVREVTSAPRGHVNGIPTGITMQSVDFGFQEMGGQADEYFSLVPTLGDVTTITADEFTAHYQAPGMPDYGNYMNDKAQGAQFSEQDQQGAGSGGGGPGAKQAGFSTQGAAPVPGTYAGVPKLVQMPKYEHETGHLTLDGGDLETTRMTDPKFTTEEVVAMQSGDTRLEELERKLEKTKQRIEEKNELIKERERDHVKEVEELKKMYSELLEEVDEAQKAAEDAEKANKIANQARMGGNGDKRADALREKLLQGRVAGEDEDDEDDEEQYIPVAKAPSRLAKYCRFCCRLPHLAGSYVPLTMSFSIRLIEKQHGVHVGSYFRFHRFLVKVNFLLSLLWVPACLLLAYNWFLYDLGLTGVYATSPSWTYPKYVMYSYWRNTVPEQLLVGFAAMLSMLLVGVMIVHRMVRRGSLFVRSEVKTCEYRSSSFIKMMFTGYDHSTPANIHSLWRVNGQRLAMGKKFRTLLSTSVITAGRRRGFVTSFKRVLLRVLVFLILVHWVALSWALVISVNRIQQLFYTASEVEKFAVPLLLYVLNLVVRWTFPRFASWEQWESPHFGVWMSHGRVYAVQILHLFPLIYSHHYIFKGAAIESFLDSVGNGLFVFQSTAVTAAQGFACPEDQIAVEWFRIILVEMLFWPWARGFRAAVLVVKAALRGRDRDRMVLNLSREGLHLAYIQALFWLAIPRNPTVVFLAVVFFYLHFKYDEFFMLTIMKRPFEHDMTEYSMLQLEGYLAGAFSVWLFGILYWFLWYAAGDGRIGTECGPFLYTEAFVPRVRELLNTYLPTGGNTLQLLWDDLFLNPVLAWVVVLFLGASHAVKELRAKAFRKQLVILKEKGDARIADLVRTTHKQARTIEAQKRSYDAMVMSAAK